MKRTRKRVPRWLPRLLQQVGAAIARNQLVSYINDLIRDCFFN